MGEILSVKDEIKAAITQLGLTTAEFRELPKDEAEDVFLRFENQFITQSKKRELWDYLIKDVLDVYSVQFAKQNGYKYLPEIAPSSTDTIWFIVDEWSPDIFRVYNGTVAAIQAVLGECFTFEYYLVSSDFTWLICENRHGMIFAVGHEVTKRLRYIAFKHSEELL